MPRILPVGGMVGFIRASVACLTLGLALATFGKETGAGPLSCSAVFRFGGGMAPFPPVPDERALPCSLPNLDPKLPIVAQPSTVAPEPPRTLERDAGIMDPPRIDLGEIVRPSVDILSSGPAAPPIPGRRQSRGAGGPSAGTLLEGTELAEWLRQTEVREWGAWLHRIDLAIDDSGRRHMALLGLSADGAKLGEWQGLNPDPMRDGSPPPSQAQASSAPLIGSKTSGSTTASRSQAVGDVPPPRGAERIFDFLQSPPGMFVAAMLLLIVVGRVASLLLRAVPRGSGAGRSTRSVPVRRPAAF